MVLLVSVFISILSNVAETIKLKENCKIYYFEFLHFKIYESGDFFKEYYSKSLEIIL